MFKSTMISLALVSMILAAPAYAQVDDPDQEVKLAFAGSTAQSSLITKINAVCAPGAFVLSAKATSACSTKQMPRLNSAGDGFINTGLGAEFNVLFRQIKN